MNRKTMSFLFILLPVLFMAGIKVYADNDSQAANSVDSSELTNNFAYQQAEQALVDPDYVFDGTQPTTTEQATFEPNVPDVGQEAPVSTDPSSSNDQ